MSLYAVDELRIKRTKLMTNQEKAQKILSNLRNRKGTTEESKMSMGDIMLLKQIANSSSDIQNVGEILIWIVKNSQHQVWSISRSEEEAKEILKHHQKDHQDEYFYIESEEI